MHLFMSMWDYYIPITPAENFGFLVDGKFKPIFFLSKCIKRLLLIHYNTGYPKRQALICFNHMHIACGAMNHFEYYIKMSSYLKLIEISLN